MTAVNIVFAKNLVPDDISKTILWNGRENGANIIPLEEELDKRLVKIRSMHMKWAYQTGLLQTGNRKSLAWELEGGEKPSMWWTSVIYERHPKLSPNLYTIYKFVCLEQILAELTPDHIKVYGADRQSRNSLQQICHSHGWNVNFFDDRGKASHKRETWKERLYFFLPPVMRALIRYLFWLVQIRRKLPDIRAKKDSFWQRSLHEAQTHKISTATIVTYFPNIDLEFAARGRFRSRYWEKLHECLNLEAQKENPDGPHFVRWLFIRFPSPSLSLNQCITLRDTFNKEGKDGLSFNYLEEFLSAKDLGNALIRWRKIALNSKKSKVLFQNNCHFENLAFNFWPYMEKDWKESFKGWRCLERCLQNAAFEAYFKSCGEQRWILFPLENCPWERMLCTAARKEKPTPPIYGSQHSMIRPTDFRYFDDPETFSNPECSGFQPDVVGVNGKAGYEQLFSNGMPQNRLRQLEALRYLYLAKYKRPIPKEPDLPIQAGEPLGYSGSKSILLVTSFFKDETDNHLDLLDHSLKAGIFQGWHITIKPHPYLPVNEKIRSISTENKVRINIAEGALEQAFAAGEIVWASNSTTSSLDALLRKKAVMVMKPAGDFDLCPVQNIPQLWRTGNIEDVKRGLQKCAPINLPCDYLDLNENLAAWNQLLALKE